MAAAVAPQPLAPRQVPTSVSPELSRSSQDTGNGVFFPGRGLPPVIRNKMLVTLKKHGVDDARSRLANRKGRKQRPCMYYMSSSYLGLSLIHI